MIIKISSRTNEKIKHVISLRNKKVRKEEGLFVSEGKKAMEMAKENNLLMEVYTLKTLNLPSEIRQYIVTRDVMDKISLSINPEGIVFVSKIPSFEIKNKNRYLFLDSLQDPGNVGTLIRTALALGYDAVFLSENTCDPFNDKAIAASKGSLFAMPVVIDAKIEMFRGNRKIVVSTLDDDSISLEKVEINEPFVLVLGNEAHGVSKDTLDVADIKVKIPMSGIESLNVAQAGAILMYELK